MSRLSDLLNPAPTTNPSSPPIKTQEAPNKKGSHNRNQSITSPLEALAIAATSTLSQPSLTQVSSPSTIYSDFKPRLYEPTAVQQLDHGLSSSSHSSFLTNHAPSYTSGHVFGRQATNGHAHITSSLPSQIGSLETAGVEAVNSDQSLNESLEASRPFLKSKAQSGIPALSPATIKQEQKSPAHETSYQPESTSEPIEGSLERASEQPQINQTLREIKKEESHGPSTDADLPSKAATPTMAVGKEVKARATPKTDRKKAGTGIAKKSAPRKRKMEVDSRGDTPMSQRSGTPNSVRPTKNAPKNKKENSETPAQSSPPPVYID